MHFRFTFHRSALTERVLLLVIALTFQASLFAQTSAKSVPVWLIGNGFHTSLALRTRDVPFAHEIGVNPRTGFVLIGWGAGNFYRGTVNCGTTFSAIVGLSPALLHVVPVHEKLTKRFAHSDVVQLDLSPAQTQKLAALLHTSFRRDARDQPIPAGRGYYADSEFYQSSERFYFPKMCNLWVAQKLHQSGVPILVAGALTAGDLVREAAQIGHLQQIRSKPADAF